VEFEDGAAHDVQRLGLWHGSPKCLTQASNGARVQLGHTGFVHANLTADLLHRCFGVVIECDHLLLALRQRSDGGAHPRLRLLALIRGVGPLRL